MVRGVNRTIIEINCTENKYFNKVLLFVDPDCSASDEQLNKRAREYIESLSVKKYDKPDRQMPKTVKNKKIAFYSVIVGALLSIAALMIFGII